MADPRVKIVSLTITEKGYCLDPATGLLDEAHPDIRHDIAMPNQPRTAPGFLLAALRRRQIAGIPPFTVMSCDNLSSNGKKLKAVLVRLAECSTPDLTGLVRNDLACPSTMVDRIVPQTTNDDRAEAEHALGLIDAWPVTTEPFTQFVIEDHFPSGRPDWAAAGAELVADVAPYEAMKLRLLNAAHTMLALIGSVAGYRTVAEAMDDTVLARFITAFMIEEALPVLNIPTGADGKAYALRLIERFRNPALRHRLEQIATDSSQKIPPRLLGTARDRMARGLPPGRIAQGIAALVLYALGFDETGQPLPLQDPMASRLRGDLIAASGNAEARIRALLAHRSIFGDLGEDKSFVEAVSKALRAMTERGVRAALG
jgi:fructuronate reductase